MTDPIWQHKLNDKKISFPAMYNMPWFMHATAIQTSLITEIRQIVPPCDTWPNRYRSYSQAVSNRAGLFSKFFEKSCSTLVFWGSQVYEAQRCNFFFFNTVFYFLIWKKCASLGFIDLTASENKCPAGLFRNFWKGSAIVCNIMRSVYQFISW